MKIKVQFHKARGLKDVETFGKQDPFVKLQVFGETWESVVNNNGGCNPGAWRACACVGCDGCQVTLLTCVPCLGCVCCALCCCCSVVRRRGVDLCQHP